MLGLLESRRLAPKPNKEVKRCRIFETNLSGAAGIVSLAIRFGRDAPCRIGDRQPKLFRANSPRVAKIRSFSIVIRERDLHSYTYQRVASLQSGLPKLIFGACLTAADGRMDGTAHCFESLSDLSYPTVLLQRGKGGGDRLYRESQR